MKLFRLATQGLIRDWRSGELNIIVIAIVVAVASLTSVGFFTDRIEQAIERQATELLAADLVLRSSSPIPETIIQKAHSFDLETTLNTGFRSVVVGNGEFQMSEVKAVADGYPIRGQLKISETLFGQERVATQIPSAGHVWLDSRLLQSLGLKVGDQIELGNSLFKVEYVLTFEPDRGGDMFNIAPRLLMNHRDLEATGLILPGSRVSYRLLSGGEQTQVAAFRQWFSEQAYENIRLNDVRDARPELKTALERANQFLGLAALVSIALAGMAIAFCSQRYVVRHLDHSAIMRCIGLDRASVLYISILQSIFLAILCSLIGCLVGYAGQQGLALLMTGLIQGELPPPSLQPVVTGLFAAVITVCGFALPQLLRLGAVSPMRVLRRHLEPTPVSSWIIYLSALLALALLLPWQSGEVTLSIYSFAGLLMTAVVLTSAAYISIKLIHRLNVHGVSLRYGLANVSRRGSQSVAQILGIGLGLMVMLLLFLIRTDMLEDWRNRLPPGTPNYFLINIQPDEVKALSDLVYAEGQLLTDFYPMIRGRLIRINDRSVSPDSYNNDRAKRLVGREFNLSFAEQIQTDNKLLSGEWWDQNVSQQFSVEEGIADTLGISIGDRLTYQVAGREVSGVVKNLRWVEWDSFNVNFFVISDPETLRDYPATYISSFYLSPSKRPLLNTIIQEFPSVTVFDVDAVLSQVRLLMERVVQTVEYVFGFTLLAGLLVLFAAMQTTQDERQREAALLRSLGASRRQIIQSLFAEFTCLGLIAGVIAAITATVVAWILSEQVFNLDYRFNIDIWLYGPLLSTVVVIGSGLIGTRHVLSTPPIRVLRQT